jgi:hypothetical protein
MTTTDWIVDIALILIVFRQLRESKLGLSTILLPLGIIGWAASQYLHGFPTAGNDLTLVAVLTVVGVIFGLVSGLLTRVRYDGDKVYVKATVAAAGVWVISMGARMAFAIWTSHASGAAHIATFSASHNITSSQSWVDALLLMAIGEVAARIAVMFVRGQLVSGRSLQPSAAR